MKDSIKTRIDKIMRVELKLNLSPREERKEEILNLMENIVRGGFKLKKEEVDILNKASNEGVKIGKIDRNIAEKLGYIHQTVNAFVVTPGGKIIIQRRVPDKSYPLHTTIYGGHLSAGQSFREGIKRELIEELNFGKNNLDNEVEFVEFSYYDFEGDTNREKRGLYIYKLSDGEYKQVLKEMKRLEKEKSIRTKSQYKNWIKGIGKKAGYGEVWALYEIDFDEIEKAKVKKNEHSKLPNKNTRFLRLTDIFSDDKNPKPEDSFLTPDLLNLILNDSKLVKKIKIKISEMKNQNN